MASKTVILGPLNIKSFKTTALIAVAVLLAITALRSARVIYPEAEEVSPQKGREYFHEKALGYPYKTGVPYPLWLALMEAYPQLMGANWEDFSRKFGTISDSAQKDGLPVGFVLQKDSWTGTSFLMTNCALCHTAQIDGVTIPGLGARDLRINAINNALMNIAQDPDVNVDRLVSRAGAIAKERNISWDMRSELASRFAIRVIRHKAKRYIAMDAGPGRNTPVEFAKDATRTAIEPPYGFVRFPAVWTYKDRNTFGWDGSMSGDLALAAASVEFNKGMPSNYIVRHSGRWDSIYQYVKSFSSPNYPNKNNAELASRGHVVYRQNCLSCHGSYAPDFRSYEERIVPLSDIGTDPDRALSLTREFAEARNKTSFGQKVPLRHTGGYVAPPLDGIWARGPYLHNGSVPTIADLLNPASERPKVFYIGGGTEYDLVKMGVATGQSSSGAYLFNATLSGNRNSGHEYGTVLKAEEKIALMEYLKTL